MDERTELKAKTLFTCLMAMLAYTCLMLATSGFDLDDACIVLGVGIGIVMWNAFEDYYS